MLGFTQAEVDHLLDEVYADYAIDPATRPLVNTTIRNHYNGYYFVNPQGGGTLQFHHLDVFSGLFHHPQRDAGISDRSELARRPELGA